MSKNKLDQVLLYHLYSINSPAYYNLHGALQQMKRTLAANSYFLIPISSTRCGEGDPHPFSIPAKSLYFCIIIFDEYSITFVNHIPKFTLL